jgi:phage shock protein A
MLYNSGRLIFASELFDKGVNNSPKKDDKSYINNRDSDLIGGTTMIDFAKIFAESSNLKEAFDKVIAQVKELNKEEADWDAIMTSFTAEAIKFVENQTKAEVDAAVQSKETELSEKMNSDKAGFDTKIGELSATIETLKTEKTALETELKAKNDKISELENQTKEAEVSAKVDEVMAEFKNSGVEFDETFSASIKDQVRTKIEAGDEDALKLFKTSVLTTFKQSKLIEASLNNGGVTPGVNDAPKSLQQELEEARNKVKNKQ